MVTVIYLPETRQEPATQTSFGVVKIDNETIQMNEDGQLYVAKMPG